MKAEQTSIYVLAPHDRPDYRVVSTFLWSDNHNVDTDGNSYNPASRVWTELYIGNRENVEERLDISPAQIEPLVLEVRSPQEYLAVRVAYFLAYHTQGQVSESVDGDFTAPQSLKKKLGIDFNVELALERVRNSRYAHTTLENPYPALKGTHS